MREQFCQYAFAEFRIKESFSVELTELYRWAVDVCEMFRFSSFHSGRIKWDETVTLTLLPAFTLFSRVASSLKLEFRFF